MSKRVLRLVSILFLSSILVLSCSNAGKTGSGDNNSGNGGSGAGGDGGTGTGGTGDGGTTPQGIAKYAGTWTAKFNANSSYDVVISNNGSVTIKDGSKNPKEATDIKKEAENKYTMTVQHGSSEIEASIVTITFTDEKSGTITDTSDGFGAGTSGVIRKQNGGNKGLWYYEGTWTLTPNQQQGQANMTMTIKNDGTIDLNIGAEQQTSINDITDKGNEIYEVKFTPNGPDSSVYILTLKFINDNSGSFTLSISDNPEGSGSGTLTKQQ